MGNWLMVDIIILVVQVIGFGVFALGFRHLGRRLEPKEKVVFVKEPTGSTAIPQIKGSEYVVIEGEDCLYEGDDLHYAKAVRKTHPGSTLIADGVNRG